MQTIIGATLAPRPLLEKRGALHVPLLVNSESWLIPRGGWRKNGELSLPRSAQGAFQALLNLAKFLRTAQLHHLETAQRSRVTAPSTLDFQGCLEADQIGSCANMFRGHFVEICEPERFVNIALRDPAPQMSAMGGKRPLACEAAARPSE